MEPKAIAGNSSHLDYELHTNHPLRLRRARGRRIEALSGTIWITAYNEQADFQLSPGQVFVVPTDRLTLVEPIGCGAVRVERRSSLRGALQRLLARWPLRRLAKRDGGGACLPASPR